MSVAHLDDQKINLLRDIPDLFPVRRDNYQHWNIKVFNREKIFKKHGGTIMGRRVQEQ